MNKGYKIIRHEDGTWLLFVYRPDETNDPKGYEEIGYGYPIARDALVSALEMEGSSDTQAMDAIHEALDGQDWSPDTLDHIASIVRSTGRPIEDPS